MAKDRPTHLTSSFVKHTDGRKAIITDGPMLNAKGDRWVCRVRFDNGEADAAWAFADDLSDHEQKPVKER